VGSYQLDLNNLVKWLCLDIDPEKNIDPDPKATAKKILSILMQKIKDKEGNETPRIWSNCIILEASRYPDVSYHIWLLFLIPVQAKAARWLGYQILEMANLSPKQIEVFPKQDALTPQTPYGNFVKLPFGKHQVEGKWSRMLDLDTFEPLPIEELENKHGLSFSETDTRHAVDILIRNLEESGAFLVFVIDELDKINSDTLLSDFFDGNQAWFQGKQGIISLTYTFGESIKETVASSVKRFSSVEMYNGVTKLEDAENIILSRAYLGVAQICQNEKTTNDVIRAIIPPETIKAILNVSAPNTFLMLERTYAAIQKLLTKT
jgi:hypothetical protein